MKPMGLKPNAKLQIRMVDGRLLSQKRVALDLTRWVGKAIDDSLTTNEALSKMRGRPVPWQGGDAKA